jgi:hypothetical protein
MTLLGVIGVSIWMAATGAAGSGTTAGAPTAPGNGPPPSLADGPAPKAAASGKLAPAIGKEMQDAIIAVNKSLGLESWPAHGVKPCIDRGGQGILAKDVTPEAARKCAAAAVDKGLPALGKSYVVAVIMGEIGPVTVIALGTGEAAGWGAYSCDPTRACKPMKINPGNKWGKRLDERRAKACSDPTTIWLPAGQKSCP